MAELVYFTGPMDCGKSTLALQIAYTETEAGRSGRLFTEGDRTGLAMITSRIGLARAAVLVEESLDFWEYVVAELSAGQRLDFLVCDEAQFYTPGQIDQLARIADELGIEVFCFGILTDFRTAMFPASRRLVELCDRMEVLQVRPRCWCGAPATHNARTVDGVMVVEGDQVVVGDTGVSNGVVSYQVLCRRHHRLRMTAQVAKADPTPDPLPFE
ncbi:MAG: thymidine kinase [Propionicimonas sp.]|nr:thymidine kinase [Propionicimonas sp.]